MQRVLTATGLPSTAEAVATTHAGQRHLLTAAELADALEVDEATVMARAGQQLPAALTFGGYTHFRADAVLALLGR